MPFVGRYVMPLNQHLGAPAIPLVAVGDRVRRGQLIAEPGAFVSTSLHSPVTGRVRAIANRRFPGGVFARSIEIETDPYATQRLEQRPAVDWRDLTKDEFVAQVQHAGIVGMGGAAFPSHVKYSIPEGQHIDHVLVNGAECEPFLTNDHRLMVERPEALLHGIEILLHNLGAREATIGVELNKPQAIAALEQHLKPSQAISVVPLQVKYPQGAEKMLIKAVYGKEVPAGELPRDLGIAVNNVGTVVAIADWFETGVPLIERIVTVSGPGVAEPLQPDRAAGDAGTRGAALLRWSERWRYRACHGWPDDGDAHRQPRCTRPEGHLRHPRIHRGRHLEAQGVPLYPLRSLPGGLPLFPQPLAARAARQGTSVRRDEKLFGHGLRRMRLLHLCMSRRVSPLSNSSAPPSRNCVSPGPTIDERQGSPAAAAGCTTAQTAADHPSRHAGRADRPAAGNPGRALVLRSQRTFGARREHPRQRRDRVVVHARGDAARASSRRQRFSDRTAFGADAAVEPAPVDGLRRRCGRHRSG